MKKLLKEVNGYIPGELRKEGLRFNWYIENKKLHSVSLPSNTTAWWFLKGIMFLKKIMVKHRNEMTKRRFGA